MEKESIQNLYNTINLFNIFAFIILITLIILNHREYMNKNGLTKRACGLKISENSVEKARLEAMKAQEEAKKSSTEFSRMHYLEDKLKDGLTWDWEYGVWRKDSTWHNSMNGYR